MKRGICRNCQKEGWIKAQDLCPVCHVIEFFTRYLTHIKGRWAGQPFKLIPWQIDLLSQAFGTLRESGLRQYRIIYCEIPKKSGKSELASGVAVYGLCADGEEGGEVYSAAGDREQASLIYYPAAQMVRNNQKLDSRLDIIDSRKRIVDYQSNSFYQVLSAESFTKHGLNPSVICFDEIHAQKSRELWDVLTEGTDIARSQQMVFVTTTAGVFDKNSIGYQLHEKARLVKKARENGDEVDPTFLPILYCADKEKDNWEDPEVWKRVNPSLGYIFEFDNLQKHYDEVKQDPSRVNNFQRFRLNLWVGQLSRYIPMDKWDKCNENVNPEALLKRDCYGGLDLSSSIDLTSFVLVFPPISEGERWKVLCKFYVPDENIFERSRKDNVPYLAWKEQGLLTATPGTSIDYGFIRKDVVEASKKYNLKEVSFDPWGAVKLATELSEEDGILMVEHRQGYKSMSPPTKDLLRMVLAGELAHSGHPILRWNADNLVVKVDPAENVKPEKDKSVERIDGVVALIMALGRGLLFFDQTSIYEKEGIFVI